MLVNLMHISVCRYDGAGAQCQSFGESAGSKILSEAETSFLKNIFELKQRKYPGIYALEPDILAGEIRDPAQEDSWILFGPILLAPANAARFQHAGRKFGKLEDIGLHLQICELNTLVAGMILYYGYLTGKNCPWQSFLNTIRKNFQAFRRFMNSWAGICLHIRSRQGFIILMNRSAESRMRSDMAMWRH